MSASARDRWRALPREVRDKVCQQIIELMNCQHCDPDVRRGRRAAMTLLRQAARREKKR